MQAVVFITSIALTVLVLAACLYSLYQTLRAPQQAFVPAILGPKRAWGLFAIAVLSRILLVLLAWVVMRFLLLSQGESPANIPTPWHALSRWDANHYQTIARNGYVSQGADDVLIVFFPMYPILIGLLAPLFGGSQLAAAIVIANLCFGAASVMLYKLAQSLFCSEKAGRIAYVALLVAPFGIFFAAPFTESLFLLVTTACLYYLLQRKYLYAALFGMVATATRSQGLWLLVPAALVALEDLAFRIKHRRRDGFHFPYKALYSALIPVGFLFYLYLNYHTFGDPFRFMVHQKQHWSQELGFFASNLAMFVRQIRDTNPDYYLVQWLPQLLSFFIGLGLVYDMARRKRTLALSGYGLAYTLFSYSPTWLLSGTRYMLCCNPLYLAIAAIPLPKWARYTLAATGAVLLFIYSMVFMSGHFYMM
nr:mannosyltransferase family protein [bacterium]